MKRAILYLMVLIMILLVTACEEPVPDYELMFDFVERFVVSINLETPDEYENLHTYFHPEMDGYDEWKQTEPWQEFFYAPITMSKPGWEEWTADYGGPGLAGDMVINGFYRDASYQPSANNGHYYCIMRKDNEDWKIAAFKKTAGWVGTEEYIPTGGEEW